MVLDIRQGFGEFHEYKLFKFPDNSIKFELKTNAKITKVVTTLRNSDDILALLMIFNVLHKLALYPELYISYMMYQQDDRLFNKTESFGLKVISNILNGMGVDKISIYHPHSDKVEFIEGVNMISNESFLKQVFSTGKFDSAVWVMPDAGAFKTQFKQIEAMKFPNFVNCMKSRDHTTGDISTKVSTEDLRGQDCFIVDDICLGGRTFISIAQELKKLNCGKLYLIVSHGIFNYGIEPLLEYFDVIYTTDSICTLEENERLKVFRL
jgi:ribose-phosphate pyrophosphokinase